MQFFQGSRTEVRWLDKEDVHFFEYTIAVVGNDGVEIITQPIKLMEFHREALSNQRNWCSGLLIDMNGNPLRLIRVACDIRLQASYICKSSVTGTLSPHITGLPYVTTSTGTTLLKCPNDWIKIHTKCFKVVQFSQFKQQSAKHGNLKCDVSMGGQLLQMDSLNTDIITTFQSSHISYLINILIDGRNNVTTKELMAAEDAALHYLLGIEQGSLIQAHSFHRPPEVFKLQPVSLSYKILLEIISKFATHMYFHISSTFSQCAYVWFITSPSKGHIFLVKHVGCTQKMKVTHLICERPVEHNVPECKEDHLKCEDATCILDIYKCDGVFDCHSRFDEMECSTSRYINVSDIHLINTHIWTLGLTLCPGHFQDDSVSQCFPSSGVCDNIHNINFEKEYCNYDGIRNYSYTSHHLLSITKRENISEINYLLSAESIYVKNCIPVTKTYNHDFAHSNPLCGKVECPSMFKCTNNYCILIENVCDGQVDCFDKTDELFCRNVSCPGFLKCRGEQRCLPGYLLCDNKVDCRYSADDELYCQSCPLYCNCSGYAILCTQYPVSYSSYHKHAKFVFPIIAAEDIPDVQNVIILDISHCSISNLTILDKVQKIIILNISNNAITHVTWKAMAKLQSLHTLDLSNNKINWLSEVLSYSLHIKVLFLKNTNIFTISRDNFTHLAFLEFIDIGDNPIIYMDIKSTQNLPHIRVIKGMSHSLCCMTQYTPVQCQNKEGVYIFCRLYIYRYINMVLSIVGCCFIAVCIATLIYIFRFFNRNFTILCYNSNIIICATLQFVYVILTNMISPVTYILGSSTFHVLLYTIVLRIFSVLAMEMGLCFGITKDIIISIKTLYPFKHQCRFLQYAPLFSLIIWIVGTINLFTTFSKVSHTLVKVDKFSMLWFFAHFESSTCIILFTLNVLLLVVMLAYSRILLVSTSYFRSSRSKKSFDLLKWSINGNLVIRLPFSLFSVLSLGFLVYFSNWFKNTSTLSAVIYMFIFISANRDLMIVLWQVCLEMFKRFAKKR